MTRRSVPEAWLPAVTPAGRRSKGIRIGLPAVAGLAVLGDEARGQVGVESDREVTEAFYHATGGPDLVLQHQLAERRAARGVAWGKRTTRVV